MGVIVAKYKCLYPSVSCIQKNYYHRRVVLVPYKWTLETKLKSLGMG